MFSRVLPLYFACFLLTAVTPAQGAVSVSATIGRTQNGGFSITATVDSDTDFILEDILLDGPNEPLASGDIVGSLVFDTFGELINETVGTWTISTPTQMVTAELDPFTLADFPDFLQIQNPDTVPNPFVIDTNIESFPFGTRENLFFTGFGPGVSSEFVNRPFNNPGSDGSLLTVPLEPGITSSFIELGSQVTIEDNDQLRRISGSDLNVSFSFASITRDRRLTLSAVPEPSSFAMLAAAAIFAIQRRRGRLSP